MDAENSGLEKKYLDATDYTVIVGMLAISTLLGVYFAYRNKRKPNTTSEYLVGNRELSVFPIAMSLSASYISAITFLSSPTEIYMYGSQVMLYPISQALAIILMMYTVLPVFYDLNTLSSYEYLTKRFNYKIGMLASVLFLIKMLTYMAVAVYTPAIILGQLSGLNYNMLIPVLTIICVFYTCIGGLRAVVWADTLQVFLMLGGTFILTILGVYHVGGFENLWERNLDGGRIEFFNMNPDPRLRSSFWIVLIGSFVSSLSHNCTCQMVVQRSLSLSTYKRSIMTLWIFCFLVFAIGFVHCFNGLVAFAVFFDCDPIKTKTVSRPDQIVPYLWMYLTRKIPALPGLFVSAIISASFSTISTVLNSMAGVFVIDIVKPLTKTPISETKATFLMKVMAIIFGCAFIGAGLLVDKLGGLYQVTISFIGITNGPVFGMFVLGMFFPRANSKGALIGGIASFGFLCWICIGAQLAISQRQIIHPKKSFSIDGCGNSTLERYLNQSFVSNTKMNKTPGEPFPLYAVSFQYYSLIGTLTAVVVGLVVSYLTARDSHKRVNVKLYSPIVRKFIQSKCKEEEEINLNTVE